MSERDDELEALRAEVAALRKAQTRAVSTKQELIETRDRLDAELRRYKQLGDYTRSVLLVQEVDAFADATAEALVEMFDLEFAAVALCDGDDGTCRVAGVCGPSRYRGRELSADCLALPEVQWVDATHPLCEQLELHEAYAAPLRGRDARLRGVLVGGTRKAKASLTAPLAPATAHSFGVVALNIDSLLRNLVAWRIIRDKNSELEASNQARTQFFANVSHEIRTPLNSIINVPAGLLESFGSESRAQCPNGHVFVLDEGEQPPADCPTCGAALSGFDTRVFQGDDDELYELLSVATRNGRYLLTLVSDILDMSRLAAGEYRIAFETVSLCEALQTAVEACRGSAEAEGVHVQVERCAGLRVRADPARLVQVLANLLGNAIKFSPRGSKVEVGVVAASGQVTISVRDYGPGIAPEHHASIFETFRQVPRSGHTRGKQGTGLGLAIARQLAEAHGGSIGLTSALGQGSTFRVVLPLLPEGGDA